MNQRQIKKYKKKLALLYLEKIVCMLDEDGGKYKAHVLRTPSAEVRTIKRLNGYRIEIRSAREDNHNYAHFHVVKGTDGMASIRIDTLEVLESSLPRKDLNKILEWALTNREILLNVWNEYHGCRIRVE